jgi:fatty-acyl-CoA synthase
VQVTLAEVHEALAVAHAEDEALVVGDRRFTWTAVAERTRRLANHLHAAGLGCHTERAALANWQSGQDHVGICCQNGNEYLETMLGAFKARVAPFNINYRYSATELAALLNDAAAAGLVYHSVFAPVVSQVRADVPTLRVLLQVDDSSGAALLPGATWYEDALAAASPGPPPVRPSPDDLYILYTGGTTGRPKGVLWRQGDAFTECFGGSPTATSMADLVEFASTKLTAVLAPPFMHGAGHWVAFHVWHRGGTVFLPRSRARLDAADIWRTVERERARLVLLVGDPFARPLLDELDRADYDLSSLTVILSGGASFSASTKDAFLSRLPTVLIVDGLGSSEAGGQLTSVSSGGHSDSGIFPLAPGNAVLSERLDRVLSPGDDEIGWLAKSGRLPLAYLNDPVKTAATYPVIDGVRYAVPGDRARLRADGRVEVQGRDSATINSGGEKIFAEEVETALKQHPAVYDCVVAGRPSPKWGQEVVAIVQLRAGAEADADLLLASASLTLARYKLPKALVFVDEVVRSPAGKPDYAWARAVAAAERPVPHPAGGR